MLVKFPGLSYLLSVYLLFYIMQVKQREILKIFQIKELWLFWVTYGCKIGSCLCRDKLFADRLWCNQNILDYAVNIYFYNGGQNGME